MGDNASSIALVTGANSGVGFGIMQRLIDLAVSLNAEASTVLVMGCRSRPRAEAARARLLQEAQKKRTAALPETLVQILIVDLSDTKSVFGACEEFKRRFHRLDALYLNAGILPCSAMDIPTGVYNLVTRPAYVAQTGGDFFKQEVGATTAEGLGAVFAANVFGHYIMVMELLTRMQRGSRVLWFSSTTASTPEFFDAEDLQCLKGNHPYESSKRLCEILAVQMHEELKKQEIYAFVVSPGNCFTGLMGQGILIDIAMIISLYLMRFLAISGCNISPRNGATAPLYLAAEVSDPAALDANMLYHSEISPLGSRSVRRIALPEQQDLKAYAHIHKEVHDLYLAFKQKAVEGGAPAVTAI
ncbi:hypothetical protein HDU86_004498 [Geranomyces michiganensis]|nr:hypothetical protein HDU86_004498 [Geranomyces michiganensis]